MENRLARESSPYLLQHSRNPVDWYPWGEEAFERARALDRPILLSIGYSACHWCHVMERESFEDAETATLMNDLFVSVKVDREERPDVDHVYMQAVQALTGRGGWPLTAFLKPDGEPFYAGTYFPPERRHGMPAFREILRAAAAGYVDRREEVDQTAARLKELITHAAARGADRASQESLGERDIEASVRRVASSFDPTHGGFGAAPKFPQPMVLEFLLRHHWRTGDPKALSMAVQTLRHMAAGGMRDHLGGGFHRYSVDERWLVPHFEKMLYDNALLAAAYARAFLLTGDDALRETAETTLDYVLADLTSPDGGFYAARDADSEGEEGVFYVWTVDEIDAVLGEDGPLFRRVYDVSAVGNFEGRNILHLPHDLDAIARAEGITGIDLAQKLSVSRDLLFDRRRSRPEPFRDEKVLTSWSALCIRALAAVGGALQRADYVQAAMAAARFLLGPARPDGALQHTYKDGVPKVPAMLSDVAGLGNALLDLYLADPQPLWLLEAEWAAEEVLERFWDEEAGLMFDTPRGGEALIVRPRDLQDGPVPSGHAMAAELLLRIGLLLGREDYRGLAMRLLQSVPDASKFPLAFSHTLSVTETTLAAPLEVVLLGNRSDTTWAELHREVTRRYLPGLVFLAGTGGGDGPASPLLVGKETVAGAPTAYVCWHHTCSSPVTDPHSLGALLDQATREVLDASPGHG